MDRDIKKMFQEKNKMILLNNLKYDLEKNINSLLETMINIFNFEFDTAIRNINSILEDSSILNSNNFVMDSINYMKLESYEAIENLLNTKKQILEDYIQNLNFSDESLNKYYELVFHTTKEFKKNLNEYSISIVKNKDVELLNQFVLEKVSKDKQDLTISRVADYLKNRLYGKLETKIHMELMIRDNNLINKAKEGYLRFQEISSKTTNK